MSHIDYTKTRAGRTPKQWLKVGSQMGDLVNKWAERTDILVYLGEDAGGPAPACWRPYSAELEVNIDVAFGEDFDARWVGDMNDRANQFAHLTASGALLHEASHARWTLFPLEQMIATKKKDIHVGIVAELFEESRIEHMAQATFPGNRSFLRSCALKIILADVEVDKLAEQGLFGMAQILLLSTARVDARVLTQEDVDLIEAVVKPALPAGLFDKLRDLWWKAQRVVDHADAWATYLPWAEEFVELLKEAGWDPETEGAEDGEEGEGGEPGDGEGKPGKGKTPAQEAMEKAIREAMEEMIEASDEIMWDAFTDAAAQEDQEADAAEATARAEKGAEKSANRKESEKTFGKGTGPGPFNTDSELVTERVPTGAERAAAVKLGNLLDRARYQDRVVTERSTATPPGKLRTAVAVQGAAARSQGRMNQTEPWRRKQRHAADDPTLKVGMMVDISGSMSRAMEPMAVTAWAFSEAGRRIQARIASVYFGNDVFPVLAPGQHLEKVQIYSAPDGTERFDRAFRALDGAIDLLGGSGARLLVIVSDMYHQPAERDAAKKWIRRCRDEGIGVLILPFSPNDGTSQHYTEHGATVISDIRSPVESVDAIGQAAIKAIEAASARRNAG